MIPGHGIARSDSRHPRADAAGFSRLRPGVRCFAVGGLFAGLTGTFLTALVHHSSPALIGLTIFLSYGAPVVVQTTTTSWPAHRLLAAGIPPIILGLALLVASAWIRRRAWACSCQQCGGRRRRWRMIRGCVTIVISTAGPDDRAGAVATLFTAGYAGVSIPVIGVGIVLQHLSPRVTLLIFALAVGLGILVAARILVRPPAEPAHPPRPDTDTMTTLCRCFGAETGDCSIQTVSRSLYGTAPT